MAIYIGVNGKAKKVKSAYIGNSNNQAVPIYKGSILPSGYLAVSYIYSNSDDQSLNTGIIPSQYTKSIVVGAIGYYNSAQGSITILNGNGNTNNSYFMILTRTGTSGSYKYYPYMGCGNNESSNTDSAIYTPVSSYNTTNINKFIMTLNKNTNKQSYYKYNGTEKFVVSNTGGNFTGSQIKLMGNSTQSFICYCVIYQNILNSATPTGEYYPCIKKSTGAAGLWNPYGNNGNGEFLTNSYIVAGPVIENYDIPNLD